MTDEILAVIRDEITTTVTAVVNGKIDKVHVMLEHQNEKQEEFNKVVQAHIIRVEPILKKAEDDKIYADGIRSTGKAVIFWGKVGSAIAGVLIAVWIAFKFAVVSASGKL